MSDITIRTSRSADAPELQRLAALDSQRVPAGDLLVAEQCGEIVAAYAPETSRAIADPFRRTADVVALLRLRAGGRTAAAKNRHGIFALPRTA
ncbi:MAG: hypothetical protein QOG77_3799 [Solirubrobacteraceae bacterium]|nr:hypothetical protein [Solirubrobacteraceae bacterium]